MRKRTLGGRGRSALREGGLAGAAAIEPSDRVRVLDVLLSYLLASLTALMMDLRDDMIRPE